MGADMLLIACPMLSDLGGTPLSPDLALPVLGSRIAALSDEVLGEVADWFLEDEIDFESEGWQHQVRSRLLRCLEALDESRRDTSQLCLEGRWWIFAGGMSWGDPPSDAYELLNGLAIAGVTDEPVALNEIDGASEPLRDEEED